MIQTIKVFGREVVNGSQKFISSSAEINKKWYKIKFVNGCNEVPSTKGIYEITFDTKNASLEKGKPYTTKNGKKGIDNPTIWIKKIIKNRPYTEEDYDRENEEVFSEVFGTSDENPFN